MTKKKNQVLQFICYFVGIVVALVLTYFIKTINQHITQEIQNADAVLTEASKVNKKKVRKPVAPIPQQKETAFVEEPEEETTPSPNSLKADKKKVIYEFPLKDVNLLQ